MKNQYSFRLTTTLLPTDTSAKTTQVINKTDSSGNKFYPNFTEETVVLTNDDRTIIETTRATCNNWTLTFVKRWLSDDDSETQIANRKLTWNPWTLCFITAWASDYIDPDDDRTWQWDQTYLWKATYKWRLITEKWVEYPHFDSLEDLQAYWTPFGWMFAVVDADWELYRYNAETETWSVVTTSTPVQPTKASTIAIGTVRWATDAEFQAWTATGSQWELLVATPAQIQNATPTVWFTYTQIKDWSDEIATAWQSASVSYTPAKSWLLVIRWNETIYQWKLVAELTISWSAVNSAYPVWTSIDDLPSSSYWNMNIVFPHLEYIPVIWWETITITLTIKNDPSFSWATSWIQQCCIWWFFSF